jgi:hypothetical protein
VRLVILIYSQFLTVVVVLQRQLLKVLKDLLAEGLLQAIAVEAEQRLDAVTGAGLRVLDRQPAKLAIDVAVWGKQTGMTKRGPAALIDPLLHRLKLSRRKKLQKRKSVFMSGDLPGPMRWRSFRHLLWKRW